MAHDLIVVGGGGTGGIKALCLLLDALPVPIAARILVAVEDRRLTAENMMTVLQGHTRLVVSTAKDRELMQLGRLYVAPRDRHLAIGPGGQALLQDRDPIHDKRPAADVLFSSAAEHFGDRVIGVVLSGDTRDGVAGFRDIHTHGGLRLAQSPSSAMLPGMPLQVTLADHPNFICTPSEMGPLLGMIVRGGVPA